MCHKQEWQFSFLYFLSYLPLMVKATMPSILNSVRNIFMRLYGSVEVVVMMCLVYKIWRLSCSYSPTLHPHPKKKKLENCVCKTQVMPPCPKPVLTPCPILTHDPQHIQSILETNVWNVKVKIAVILSKNIFLCAKKHKYIFNMLLIAVQKFQNECLKTLKGADYTILIPLNET